PRRASRSPPTATPAAPQARSAPTRTRSRPRNMPSSSRAGSPSARASSAAAAARGRTTLDRSGKISADRLRAELRVLQLDLDGPELRLRLPRGRLVRQEVLRAELALDPFVDLLKTGGVLHEERLRARVARHLVHLPLQPDLEERDVEPDEVHGD